MFVLINASLIRAQQLKYYYRTIIAIAYIAVLLTTFCCSVPLRGQGNNAAGNPVNIPGTPYQITPPPDWLVKNNPAVNNVKLTSPDALMWMLVNAMPLQQGELSKQQMVEDTIAELVANLPAGGNWLSLENRLIDQPTELMRLQVYEGTINKKTYQLALIARAEKEYIFAFYALMIPALHDTAWPMLQKTASSLAKGDLPATTRLTLPVTWTLHGTAPAGWLRSLENDNTVSFTPTAEAPMVELTITRINQEGNVENITSLSKALSATLLNMPAAKLLREDDIKLAGVTAHLIEGNYLLQEIINYKQLLLLPAPDVIFQIEFAGSSIVCDNYLNFYQTFISELTLDKATITPAEPTGELISLADIGLQFTIPAGWESSKNGSLYRYTPPVNTGLSGVEFTIKAQKTSKTTADAAEAGRQFRMRLPLKAKVVKLLDGEVNGLTFCLTEYMNTVDNNTTYRRIYYFDLPTGMAEINCKLTTSKAVDIERSWQLIEPLFDKIITSISENKL